MRANLTPLEQRDLLLARSHLDAAIRAIPHRGDWPFLEALRRHAAEVAGGLDALRHEAELRDRLHGPDCPCNRCEDKHDQARADAALEHERGLTVLPYELEATP